MCVCVCVAACRKRGLRKWFVCLLVGNKNKKPNFISLLEKQSHVHGLLPHFIHERIYIEREREREKEREVGLSGIVSFLKRSPFGRRGRRSFCFLKWQ